MEKNREEIIREILHRFERDSGFMISDDMDLSECVDAEDNAVRSLFEIFGKTAELTNED